MKWVVGITCLLLLVYVFLGAAYPWFLTVQAGMAGKREADAQWAAGKATIYAIGGYAGIEPGAIDPATGLPLEEISMCVVNSKIMARLRSHNDRICDLIAKHGLPTNSRLKQEPGLSAVRQTWKDRLAHGEIPVTIGITEAQVTAGTAGRVYRVSAPTGMLEVDGGSLPLIVATDHRLEALGGSVDEKVLYLRHWNPTSGLDRFEAVEVSGVRLVEER